MDQPIVNNTKEQKQKPVVNSIDKKSGGRTQRIVELESKVQQLEMAVKVSQMFLQQLSQQMQPLQNDLGELANRQRELQYRTLSMNELLKLDIDEINAISEKKQIADFNEASDKEDKEMSYTITDVVAEDSVVIVTTDTEDKTKSILRSKIIVSQIGIPKLKEDILGKKVNDKFETDINGTNHTVTVLSICKTPEKLEVKTNVQKCDNKCGDSDGCSSCK